MGSSSTGCCPCESCYPIPPLLRLPQKRTQTYSGAFENFGFILNATYRVYDQAPNGMNLKADFVYPSNVPEAFYQKLKEIDPMPAPLSIANGLGWNVEYNDVSYRPQKSLSVANDIAVRRL